MKRLRNAILVALVSVPLGACGFTLIDTQPPPQIYDLGAPAISSEGEKVTWQLIVEEPTTIRALSTNRIALKDADNAFQYYSGARWSDRGPKLLETRIVQALEDSGRIGSVGGTTTGINSRFRLKGTLREFHSDISSPKKPVVHVTLSLKLFDARTRGFVASILLEETVEAGSKKTDAVVAAFDKAVMKVSGDAANWALEQGQASFSAE